jgi:hypothetical protein
MYVMRTAVAYNGRGVQADQTTGTRGLQERGILAIGLYLCYIWEAVAEAEEEEPKSPPASRKPQPTPPSSTKPPQAKFACLEFKHLLQEATTNTHTFLDQAPTDIFTFVQDRYLLQDALTDTKMFLHQALTNSNTFIRCKHPLEEASIDHFRQCRHLSHSSRCRHLFFERIAALGRHFVLKYHWRL